MAEDVVKVPILNLELAKPKPWDFAALATLLAGVGTAVANVALSGRTQPGVSISTSMTWGFVLIQMILCLGSLLILGKTAKEGTLHGNLLSVGGMLIGLGGMLLAAALWAAG